MGSIGVPELIIIFVVALIVFGPRKLPELGKSLGKGLAEFRRASNELKSTIEDEVRAIESETANETAARTKTAGAAEVKTDLSVESESPSESSTEAKVDAH